MKCLFGLNLFKNVLYKFLKKKTKLYIWIVEFGYMYIYNGRPITEMNFHKVYMKSHTKKEEKKLKRKHRMY